MTQTERIREIIEDLGEGTLFDNAEIQERTGFPRTSIRRVLGKLSKTGIISRRENGLYRINTARTGGQVDEPLIRKYVSGLFYCNSDVRRQFFASTFERNDIDRQGELLAELERAYGSDCSEIRDNFGYSQDEFFESETNLAIYPEIETGEV